MKSIFTEKEITPSQKDLKKALGSTFPIWQELQEYTKKSYPGAVEEWNFSSPKYGWSFRVKDKKRVILYLLPREQFFKVAMVFGQKATNEILNSNVADMIKQDLQNARVYAEGRGIRIDITDKALTTDIKTLISIKLSH
ncbi:MAG: DUF3788 domain-containing protein [Chitinophagaceae bacterium]|nr:DUF3788 domain-containing protein [Chitinophagaceae bacterium]MBL0336830.1 DUF3788 domain-containing protein [Chitinophagaceae bacterium]